MRWGDAGGFIGVISSFFSWLGSIVKVRKKFVPVKLDQVRSVAGAELQPFSSGGDAMTITLNPNQEEAVRAAIRAGQIGSVEELIDRALAGLPHESELQAPTSCPSVAEQGLGLFGTPEDAALLDEIVAMAYAERRRPSQRKPTL